jgi:hypothetical protein
MTKEQKKTRPGGTEPAKWNIPSGTMDALRAEAGAEGCSVTHIAVQVLNAYARGDIRKDFTQVGEIGRR